MHKIKGKQLKNYLSGKTLNNVYGNKIKLKNKKGGI